MITQTCKVVQSLQSALQQVFNVYLLFVITLGQQLSNFLTVTHGRKYILPGNISLVRVHMYKYTDTRTHTCIPETKVSGQLSVMNSDIFCFFLSFFIY